MLPSAWGVEEAGEWLRAAAPAAAAGALRDADGAALLTMQRATLLAMLQAAGASASQAEQAWCALERLRRTEDLANRAAALQLAAQDCELGRRYASEDDDQRAVWEEQLAEAQRELQAVQDALQAASLASDAALAAAAAEAFAQLAEQERADSLLAHRMAGLAPPPASAAATSSASAASGMSGATSDHSTDAGASSAPADEAAPGPSKPPAAAAAAAASSSAAASDPDYPQPLARQHLVHARQRGLVAVVQVPPFRQGPSRLLGFLPKRAAADPKGKGKGPAAVEKPSLQLANDSCLACLDAFAAGNNNLHAAFQLPCGSSLCDGCATQLMRTALDDVSLFPLKCEGQTFDAGIADALLAGRELQTFHDRLEEHTCTNKMYCPSTACSKFINLDDLGALGQLGESACPACDTPICTSCKVAWHQHLTCEQYQALPEDQRSPDDATLVSVAQQMGWKRCPQCRYFVSLSQGCYHMTCRCSHHFCYLCTARWKTCGCVQWDEDRLLNEAHERVMAQAAAEGVNVRNVDREEVQQAVLATADFLRDNHECDHLWQRRHPPTSRNCHHCRHFEMYVYSYHCRICSMSVCNTCRFYRMQQ